jgi:hypothetical protein
MERCGHGKQDLAEIEKKYPRHQKAGETLGDFDERREPTLSHGKGRGRLTQTGGAQHPVRMLGDTFPAEITAAFRAPGDRFTKSMMSAALMDQIISRAR